MAPERQILKRASASRSSGEWNDDDFDVLEEDGAVVGRIMKATLMAQSRVRSRDCNPHNE